MKKSKMDNRVYYSQNREDLILESFFLGVKKGFYVDVGAYHPDADSVTKRFYLNGWEGINIEPQKNLYRLFEEKRKRDINLNIGVSNKKTTLMLRSYSNQGLSTFSSEIKKNNSSEGAKGTTSYEDIKVNVETLKTVFENAKVSSIQFLKIDVEGYEYEVLEGNDWEKFRPEVICIEADHVVRDWNKLLLSKDYIQVFFDGLNKYYADSRTGRPEKFKYIEHVVLGLHGGVSAADQQRVNRLQKVNHKYSKLVKNYQNTVDHLNLLLEQHKVQNKLQAEQLNHIAPLLMASGRLAKSKFRRRKNT